MRHAIASRELLTHPEKEPEEGETRPEGGVPGRPAEAENRNNGLTIRSPPQGLPCSATKDYYRFRILRSVCILFPGEDHGGLILYVCVLIIISTCSVLTLTASHQPQPPTWGVWGGVVECSWVWLGVVGCGWVWLGVVGCGGVWWGVVGVVGCGGVWWGVVGCDYHLTYVST